MAKRRKPISFNTTLRNPERIPSFVSVLSKYEGKILNSENIKNILAEIIQLKIFVPTRPTLGTYVESYNDKFTFRPKDLSKEAAEKVSKFFNEWSKSEAGTYSLSNIIYLLDNTITKHKEAGWEGGWESRFDTQYSFIKELGFVYAKKNEKIRISETGKLLIKNYKNGVPIDEGTIDANETSAYLNGFAKYQTNNPYRKNTVDINFFPLVLNVIKYMNDKYGKNGISRQDIPFIICWTNNDYVKLGDYIYNFRKTYGYTTSDEIVYDFALGIIEDSQEGENGNFIKEASAEYLNKKKKDYKFDKIMRETPDEVIRKLRQTQLISLKGAGRFIDINRNRLNIIEYISNKFITNIDFQDNEELYFDYMGAIDNKLIFDQDEPETTREISVKEAALQIWAKDNEWEYLTNQITNGLRNTQDPVLRLMNAPTRLEFLSAIILKKALPHARIVAHYKADDQGIPYNTAGGSSSKNIGADIDVFEEDVHAIVEPSAATSRSMQVEHELPSIRNHLINSVLKDKEKELYKEWFALFITPRMTKDVGDHVAAIKIVNNINIYPWNSDDFVEYSKNIKSVKDYREIRDYAKPQRI